MKNTVKKHAHLVGLCGAGMRSLADYLLADGWAVSGSDQSISPGVQEDFAARGVETFSVHCEKNVPSATTLLIHSLAIPEENPERAVASQRGISSYSYVEYLGTLFQKHRGIGIAGSHGKTTTCAILAHLLGEAGCNASVISGGRLQGKQEFGLRGKSDLLVAECCEFQQSFLNYSPAFAVLLGIEADHFDCYPDEDSLLDAFSRFCEKVDPQGTLVINGDCELSRQAAQSARCAVVRFSVGSACEEESDWQVTSITPDETGTGFSICSSDGESFQFEVPMYGQHQVANSLAAVLIARELGLAMEAIIQGLKSFPGVERRFEIRGEYRGTIFVDDYAHHPSEIKATLQAARQRFGSVRLIVAFQPHQILRTESLLEEFAGAFSQADRVIILPIYAAREQHDQRVETVARELVRRGNEKENRLECENSLFEYCSCLDHLRQSLDDSLLSQGISSKDVFLTLGAGDIDRIYYELPGFIR